MRVHRGRHQGAIVSMDACRTGSLVATAGTDHTVRLWDASQRVCLMCHPVTDDLTCVALHPAAHSLLLGMHDKCRLFQIIRCAVCPAPLDVLNLLFLHPTALHSAVHSLLLGMHAHAHAGRARQVLLVLDRQLRSLPFISLTWTRMLELYFW